MGRCPMCGELFRIPRMEAEERPEMRKENKIQFESEERSFFYYMFLPVRDYAGFEGRARRKEYWGFTLFNLSWIMALFLSEKYINGNVLAAIFVILYIGLYIPRIAVAVRRLHDIGFSGYWLLLSLVPLANLSLLFFYMLDSQPGANKYGPCPKPPRSSGSEAHVLSHELNETAKISQVENHALASKNTVPIKEYFTDTPAFYLVALLVIVGTVIILAFFMPAILKTM